jgi:hypothetical protein
MTTPVDPQSGIVDAIGYSACFVNAGQHGNLSCFSAPTNSPSRDSARAASAAALSSDGEKAIKNSGNAISCARLLPACSIQRQAFSKFSCLPADDLIWATAILLIGISKDWYIFFSQAIQVTKARQVNFVAVVP